jgi:hypothetical protein
MNEQKATQIKREVARIIMKTGEDIDLKHACRLARRYWRNTPTTRRSKETLEFVSLAAVARAYELGLKGGTWSPWQRIRKMFVPRSKYDPATEEKRHKEERVRLSSCLEEFDMTDLQTKETI